MHTLMNILAYFMLTLLIAAIEIFISCISEDAVPPILLVNSLIIVALILRVCVLEGYLVW